MGNKYKKKLDNKLQTIREELGYSQKQMAKKLGLTEKTIRNYECNETNLPLEHALYLSKTYGYTLDWIYCNSSKKKSDSNIDNDNISKFTIDMNVYSKF